MQRRIYIQESYLNIEVVKEEILKDLLNYFSEIDTQLICMLNNGPLALKRSS